MKKYYTAKLYHNKYPYKVELQSKIPSQKKTKQLTTNGWVSQYADNRIFKNSGEFKLWKKWVKDVDNRLRISVKNVWIEQQKNYSLFGSFIVYFSKKEDYTNFVNTFSTHVVEVYEPLNDQHLDKLLQNATVIFRTKLFYNKYKYSIRFARKSRNCSYDVSEISNWVKNQYINDNEEIIDRSEKFLYRPTSWFPILYINDYDDLIMANLAFSDRIIEIKQIELLDESAR
jgi:hypothetical protein